jgi:hypothetical protein
MAISCDPNDLAEASKCFDCIPKNIQNSVIIYLLNVISELNLTPEQLVENSKCYDCIPKNIQPAVQTYLLCQISNAAGA